jgi:asparagine synthase (glutamine-hydrolysing)
MSGFAGIVRFSDREDVEPSVTQNIERMATAVAVRGPDGLSSRKLGSASFCFSLLRTGPAPQAETQPFTLDGCTWFLGDVRLDGRNELIRRLKSADEACAPQVTDEELVLRTWKLREGFGSDAIFQDLLLGDYTFVLWEPERCELQCVRSLSGARPFLYCLTEKWLSFSNSFEALSHAPGISKELDSHFLGDFLLQSWCPDQERTVYRDIRRLPPGHVLTVTNEHIHLRRVAKLPIEEPLVRKRPEEYVEEYRALLHEAVRDRLPQDSAVIFLSGGLDSSTVAATAIKILNESNSSACLSAYTVDYRPLFDDREGEFASRVARHLGIPLEISHGGECAPFSGWNGRGFSLPEPQHEPFFLLQVQQYRWTAARARVALTGDGGDDVLLAPAWAYLKYLVSQNQWGSVVKSFGGYFLRHGRIPPLRAGIRARVQKWMGKQEAPPEYPQWLADGFERKNKLRERWRELQTPPKEEHPLHPRAYADLTGPFWPNAFEAEDPALCGVGLEIRAPLLDARLLRFLLRLPPVPWCSDKEIVRRAARGVLPEKIRLRPKSPLLEDPLDVHIQKMKWFPAPAGPPSEFVQTLVDWRKWTATPKNKPGSALWSVLRPFSLDLWWKSVEMRERIQ